MQGGQALAVVQGRGPVLLGPRTYVYEQQCLLTHLLSITHLVRGNGKKNRQKGANYGSGDKNPGEKSSRRKGDTESEMKVAILLQALRAGFMEKVTFEQYLGGGRTRGGTQFVAPVFAGH